MDGGKGLLDRTRGTDCWVCPDCETECPLTEENCIICGYKRDASAVIKRAGESDYARLSMPSAPSEGPAYTTVHTDPVHYKEPTTIFHDGDEYVPYAPAEKSGAWKVWLIIGAVLTAIIVSVVVYLSTANSRKYSDAMDMYDSGNYEAAIELFDELPGEYKDAEEMLHESRYQLAVEYMEDGMYEDARMEFELIIDYEDSQTMIYECRYMEGMEYYNDGDYSSAKAIFEEISYEYSPADDMLDECDYQVALECYYDGEYVEAMKRFNDLGYYSNSRSMFNSAESALLQENKRYGYFYDEYDMIGEWEDDSGNYVNYEDNYDGTTHTSYNLPYNNGTYYKISNGIHYHGSNYSGWEKQWIYEYVSSYEVNVYAYKDGSTYTLSLY